MKLSIITINYNNLAGLKKTAESVISQTWRDFEWIIIDGGSTDGSKEYIEQLADNSVNNISCWCSEPDKGIYNALNKGISHCYGEYISCMNSGDEFYDRNTLKLMHFESKKGDILLGDCLCIGKNNDRLISYKNVFDFYYLYTQGICHQAVFVKQTIYKQYGFDEQFKIAADYALWLRLSMKNYSFEYCPIIVCKSDLNGISNDSSYYSIQLQEIERSRQLYIPLLVRTYIEAKEQYENDYSDYVFLKRIKKNGGFWYLLFVLFKKICGLCSV